MQSRPLNVNQFITLVIAGMALAFVLCVGIPISRFHPKETFFGDNGAYFIMDAVTGRDWTSIFEAPEKFSQGWGLDFKTMGIELAIIGGPIALAWWGVSPRRPS